MLWDAVAILIPDAAGALLAQVPVARDFVADAYAHKKFIGYLDAAKALFDKAGIDSKLDQGFVKLDAQGASIDSFIQSCRKLRYWDRKP